MKKNALSVIKTQKWEAPTDWSWQKFEDTGENFFSGKFRVSGYIVDVQDYDHPQMPVHFMLCSDRPDGNRLDINANQFGGCGGISNDANGHARLFHLFENLEIEINPEILDQLCGARDLRKKIVVYGQTVQIDLEDRAAQASAFKGWDQSNRCPVVVISKIIDAPRPKSLIRRARETLKPFWDGVRPF